MELRTLRIFRAVALEGSVSRAARKLNYVQPNVTARIRQLEKELGTTLFYRMPRGMVITPSGKTLLKYTEKITRVVKETKDALGNNQSFGDAISIGCTASLASNSLPMAVSKYHEKYPDVHIRIKTMVTGKLVSSVLNYTLEGAFVSGPVNNSNVISETLFNNELVLVTSKTGVSEMTPPRPPHAFIDGRFHPSSM